MINYKKNIYIALAGILLMTIMLLLVVHTFNHTSESGKKVPEKTMNIYNGD